MPVIGPALVAKRVRQSDPMLLGQLLLRADETAWDLDDTSLGNLRPSSPTLDGPAQASSHADRLEDNPAQRPPQVDGYQVIQYLGRGGMGVVWKAIQLGTDRHVAIKILCPGRSCHLPAIRQFKQEVSLASSLAHPNIARVYDSGIHRLDYFYAMEFVDGDDLNTFVRRGCLDQCQVLRLVAKVCHAVHHAHGEGVVHGDLKPSNILVTPDGEPHVLDFGLARALDDLPLRGCPAGTVAYMAPEQVSGWLFPQTDVYGLGVILYEVLVGFLPRRVSGSPVQALRDAATTPVTLPRHVQTSMNKELQALLLKALAAEPEQRYRSCAEMARDIERFLEGRLVAAYHYTWVGMAATQIRRYRYKLLVCTVILCCSVAVLGVYSRGIMARRTRIAAEASRVNFSRYLQQIFQAREALAINNTAVAQRVLEQCPRQLRSWEWQRLSLLADQSDLTLDRRHSSSSPILAATIDPGTRQILVVDEAGAVSTYDPSAGTRLGQVTLGDQIMIRAVFGLQHKRLMTVSESGQFKLWDTDSFEPIASATGRVDHRYANTLHAAGGIGAFIDTQGQITIVDLHTGQLLARHEAPKRTRFVRCSAVGRRLVAVGETVRWWDLDTGLQRNVVFDHGHSISALAIDDSGQRMFLGNVDGTVDVFDLTTEARVIKLSGHQGPVRHVIGGFDHRQIFTSGDDCTIRAWNLDTRQLVVCLRGHHEPVRFIASDHRNDGLTSVDVSNVLRTWRLEHATGQTTLQLDSACVVSAFDPDGRQVVWSGLDGRIRLRSAVSPRVQVLAPSHRRSVRALAFSPDGNLMASGGDDGTIRIWNTASGQQQRLLEGCNGQVLSLAIHDDPYRVIAAVAGTPNGICVWNGQSNAPKLVLEGMPPFALGRHGNQMAFVKPAGPGRIGESVVIWDLEQGRLVREFGGQTGQLRSLAWSRDRNRMACSYRDNTVKVLDANTGEHVSTLQSDRQESIFSLAFSSDDKRLITAGESIRLWDVVTGQHVYTVDQSESGPFLSVDASADGKTLVARNLTSVTTWASH